MVDCGVWIKVKFWKFFVVVLLDILERVVEEEMLFGVNFCSGWVVWFLGKVSLGLMSLWYWERNGNVLLFDVFRKEEEEEEEMYLILVGVFCRVICDLYLVVGIRFC